VFVCSVLVVSSVEKVALAALLIAAGVEPVAHGRTADAEYFQYCSLHFLKEQ
jgi:hypothetical protein